MQAQEKSVTLGIPNSSAPIHLPLKSESQTADTVQRAGDTYLRAWPLATVTFSLCLGTFLVALDVNIIGVAVPKIAAVFKSLDDIAWYGSAYLLTITAFQPVTGFVYKYFNIRVTYLCSIVLFEGKIQNSRIVLTGFN